MKKFLKMNYIFPAIAVAAAIIAVVISFNEPECTYKGANAVVSTSF